MLSSILAEVAGETLSTVTIDAIVVTLLVSLVIPLLNGILTKANASAGVHQIVTLVLSAATGFLATATQADGTAVFSMHSLFLALLALVVSIASYLGIYKPHNANAKLGADKGLG